MSLPPQSQHNEQQLTFVRQASILRKNLNAWEATICSARGEDWPSMLGRLNAAFVSRYTMKLITAISPVNDLRTDIFFLEFTYDV